MDFDNTVQHWVDYSQFSLDIERHIYDVNWITGDSENLNKNFAAYWEGLLFLEASLEKWEELEDRVRLMLEESDFLQAFQFITDVDSGFQGIR